MAFGSGSSLGTDRWTRRSGFPSSVQLLKVGKATLLHQHSSKKPTAHSRRGSARRISRSRRLFSLVHGVGGGDPALRPLPPHPEKARERRPDGLAGEQPWRYSFLEGDLGGHLQSPQAALVAELSRAAVEHLPQGLGTLLVESGMDVLGARRTGRESVEPTLVEGMDIQGERVTYCPRCGARLEPRLLVEALLALAARLGSAHLLAGRTSSNAVPANYLEPPEPPFANGPPCNRKLTAKPLRASPKHPTMVSGTGGCHRWWQR